MSGDTNRGIDSATVATRQSYVRWVNGSLANALPNRPSDDLSILCECGDRRCHEWITLSNAAYQAALSEDSSYIVTPGHEAPDLLGRVKHRYATYMVVDAYSA